MIDAYFTAELLLLIANVVLLIVLLRRVSKSGGQALARSLEAFEKIEERIERTTRDESAKSRDEMNKAAREQRLELTEIVKNFGDSVAQRIFEVANLQKGQLEIFSEQLNSFAKSSGDRLDAIRGESARSAKQLREEVVTTLRSISETMATTQRSSGSSENSA